MPRPKLPEDQRLVVQPLRISPEAKAVLEGLSTKEKKEVIATVREMAERIIISFRAKPLAKTKSL